MGDLGSLEYREKNFITDFPGWYARVSVCILLPLVKPDRVSQYILIFSIRDTREDYCSVAAATDIVPTLYRHSTKNSLKISSTSLYGAAIRCNGQSFAAVAVAVAALLA